MSDLPLVQDAGDGWHQTDDSRIRLRSDGLLECRHRAGKVLTLESARAQFAFFAQQLGERAPAPLLVILGELKGQNSDARAYLAGSDEVVAVLTRCALVMSSAVSRVIANMFLGFARPRVELRTFAAEEAALTWLREGLR